MNVRLASFLASFLPSCLDESRRSYFIRAGRPRLATGKRCCALFARRGVSGGGGDAGRLGGSARATSVGCGAAANAGAPSTAVMPSTTRARASHRRASPELRKWPRQRDSRIGTKKKGSREEKKLAFERGKRQIRERERRATWTLALFSTTLQAWREQQALSEEEEEEEEEEMALFRPRPRR